MAEKLLTKRNVEAMPQVTDWKPVPGLAASNFKMEDGGYFIIKNQNDSTVILEVKPAHGDNWVLTKFYPGWNIDIVKEVKQNLTLSGLELSNILYGV